MADEEMVAVLPKPMTIEWASPTGAMIEAAALSMVRKDSFLAELFEPGELFELARAALLGAAEARRVGQ